MKKISLLFVGSFIFFVGQLFCMSDQACRTMIDKACSNHERLGVEILSETIRLHCMLKSREFKSCSSWSVITNLPARAYEEQSKELNSHYKDGLCDMIAIINQYNEYFSPHIPINKIHFYNLIEFTKRESFNEGRDVGYSQGISEGLQQRKPESCINSSTTSVISSPENSSSNFNFNHTTHTVPSDAMNNEAIDLDSAILLEDLNVIDWDNDVHATPAKNKRKQSEVICEKMVLRPKKVSKGNYEKN